MSADFSGIRKVIPPVNEPIRVLRPGLAREGVAQGASGGDGRRGDRHSAHHRRAGDSHRRSRPGGDAARPQARARHLPPRPSQGRGGRDCRRAGGQGRVGELVVGRPRRRVPQGRRPAGHDLARHAERRHHAQPVEDGLPVGDRRGLRAGGLLALQRGLLRRTHGRAAGLHDGDVEPDRLPPARRASSTRCRRSTSRPSAATSPRRPR